MMMIAMVLGAVGILASLWASWHGARRHRFITDTPTSKVKGVFVGQVEVRGTAESSGPLTSFLAGVANVYYTYEISEHWSRTVTESYTDSDGRRKTRTKTESGWKTVDSETKMIPFYLQDDTGLLLIRPEGAKVEAVTVFEQTCSRAEALYYGKGPAGGVPDSTGRRRFVEKALTLHVPLFVIGKARERQDVVAPEIAQDPDAEMFLISTRSEEQVVKGYRWMFWGFGFLGFALTLIPLLIGAVQSLMGLSILGLALAPTYLAVWGLGWLWLVYNSLMGLKNRVARAWSLIDVECKRRNDLIPRLVEVARGLRDYERNLQEELARLRTQSVATPSGEPGPDIAESRSVLTVVVEKYPELKSNETFLNLQRELSNTEDRLALARDYYNSIATQYNTRLEILPDSWVARLAGLRPRTLLEAEGLERAAVAITLAD
ncbi:MAG: LemA family protein [Verrucomicrobiae bacterium]|nr:LemA family protein [Verrucomicrobiae bacterium]